MTKEEFEIHLPDPKNPSSLSDAQIESIMMDNSGAIWLGSARSLMKHDSEKKKFSLISNSEKSEIQSLLMKNGVYLLIVMISCGRGAFTEVVALMS